VSLEVLTWVGALGGASGAAAVVSMRAQSRMAREARERVRADAVRDDARKRVEARYATEHGNPEGSLRERVVWQAAGDLRDGRAFRRSAWPTLATALDDIAADARAAHRTALIAGGRHSNVAAYETLQTAAVADRQAEEVRAAVRAAEHATLTAHHGRVTS